MRQNRASLEAAFMRLCQKHGPNWIESIIRPLRLPGAFISVKDIPITALSAVGRTYLSAGAGYIADATGWMWFFVICALSGLPGLALLWWLQVRGHFDKLAPARK